MANNKKRNRSNGNKYSLYQYSKNNNQLYTPRKNQNGPFPESIRMEETNMIEIKTDNQGNQTKRCLKHKSITINGSKKY